MVMDLKQKRIFRKILDKEKLPYNNIFMQFRNLKEFKSFNIERVNPNHKIILYGNLKRKFVKDGNNNRIIKVGEILLCFMPIFTIQTSLLIYMYSFIAYLFFLSLIFEKIIDNNKILKKVYYAYWYRGKYWLRKNCLCC